MLRKENLERIVSEAGCELKMNRSIQAEGSFAEIKQDMGFRRYLSKGKKNVLAESVLLAIAHNINKLHNKIQSDRTRTHLFPLKKVHNFKISKTLQIKKSLNIKGLLKCAIF